MYKVDSLVVRDITYVDGPPPLEGDGSNITNLQWSNVTGRPPTVVETVNGRYGTVTLISSDVTDALGFTPLNKAGGTMTGTLTVNAGIVAYDVKVEDTDGTSSVSSIGNSVSRMILQAKNTTGGPIKEIRFLEGTGAGTLVGQIGYLSEAPDTTGTNLTIKNVKAGGSIILAAPSITLSSASLSGDSALELNASKQVISVPRAYSSGSYTPTLSNVTAGVSQILSAHYSRSHDTVQVIVHAFAASLVPGTFKVSLPIERTVNTQLISGVIITTLSPAGVIGAITGTASNGDGLLYALGTTHYTASTVTLILDFKYFLQ